MSITYGILLPSGGNLRPVLVDANDFAHILEARVGRDDVEERRPVLLADPRGDAAPTHFPQDEAERVNVDATERLEHVHVDSITRSANGIRPSWAALNELVYV